MKKIVLLLALAAALALAGCSNDPTGPTADADKAVVFRIELSSGAAELQTAFLTTDEEELCGAYYVYVKRIE